MSAFWPCDRCSHARRLALALATSLSPGLAGAEDRSRGELATVVFGSLDAGRSVFASVGFKRTLAGPLDRDGIAVLGSAGTGARFERDWASAAPSGAPPTVMRRTGHVSLLAGYQWMVPGGAAALFAGPEGDIEELADGRPRSRLGARLHAELWLHPTTDTLLTATAILGSARGEAWTRASAGLRTWGDVFVGPEVSLYADRPGYREWHLGAHVTGLTLGRFTTRLSGGWFFEDQSGKSGPYFGLSGHVRF